MELVSGGVDFRDVVVARQQFGQPFTSELILNWANQLASGLSYLHDECKLVHQDLHNGNVMIASQNKLPRAIRETPKSTA